MAKEKSVYKKGKSIYSKKIKKTLTLFEFGKKGKKLKDLRKKIVFLNFEIKTAKDDLWVAKLEDNKKDTKKFKSIIKKREAKLDKVWGKLTKLRKSL